MAHLLTCMMDEKIANGFFDVSNDHGMTKYESQGLGGNSRLAHDVDEDDGSDVDIAQVIIRGQVVPVLFAISIFQLTCSRN